MRLFNLFPWRFVVRRIAHRKGFLDPLEVLARLRRFSQPSEVQEPIELIRAGMVFHARGLLNTKVIQHNLDWIWPYWIVRQFSPEDTSFIPRAFSFSHVNLTHRNWTALGVPGSLQLPIVDPRGMVTPHHDDWSLDHWFIAGEGEDLFPSTLLETGQRLLTDGMHRVETTCGNASAGLELESEVLHVDAEGVLVTEITVNARESGRLAVSLRPCNPEGIQFIEEATFSEGGKRLSVGGSDEVRFEEEPDETYVSDYEHGDVVSRIRSGEGGREVTCKAGLATAAAVYRVQAGERRTITCRVPLREEGSPAKTAREGRSDAVPGWERFSQEWTRMEIPDTRFREIFDSSQHTLALLSEDDILPGPYTYRRFWFRDACLIGNALLGLGREDRVHRALRSFPWRQRMDGYFHSQEGEWDSNGQVLWLADRYEEVTGRSGESMETTPILRAARWIDRKRWKTRREEAPVRGLLPAGFSAEHLGPNDYYYWDDFWGAAGLRAASRILERRREGGKAAEVRSMAEAFEADILASLATLKPERTGKAIPAAPRRRMDSGAIGSLVADYPLRLEWVPTDQLLATADWLMDHSFHKGGFFQNMIHSGINAYLTLAIAQTLLAHGDSRYWALIQATADIATPTGKWPEAVHPHTEGGCMGDGEHAWAAAEWCQMMRALFIEESEEALVIGKGLPSAWLDSGERLAFGPTCTRWGRVSVFLEPVDGRWHVRLDGEWNDSPPAVKVCLAHSEEPSLELVPTATS
jgi:PAS domain-containing protein